MRRAPQGLFEGEHLGRSLERYEATGEFRPPIAGEFYLSGAIIQAYRANGNLSDSFWIAKPVKLTECPCCKGTGKVKVQS